MKSTRATPLLCLLLFGCGPGVSDGAYTIKNGYLFYETGGNGRTIRFEEGSDWSRTVVPERVDSYVVDGALIIVARRPADIVMRNGIADWELHAVCEYWKIDTQTHEVEQISDASEWPTVRCK